jgi:iron-sulfur cluster assembly protein
MDSQEIQIVELTDSAVNQVIRLLTKEPDKNPENYGLRLAIKGGGCSGLSYSLSFDEKVPKDLEQNFSNSDSKSALKNIKVFVDPKSAIYLKGMIVDFDDGLMGKGFVFKNPNATNTCGCGESFSVF